MAKFVFLYTGGSMAATPQEQEQVMQAWGAWFGELGAAVLDGGNPFGGSTAVGPDGAVTDGALSRATGYSLISADSLSEAGTLAKGCPVLTGGGSVEVYQALDM